MTDRSNSPSASKQREPRSARLFSAELAVAGGPSQRIVIKDVSRRGCGARADQTPLIGANVTLLLHGIGLVEGTVAWLEKGRFGIRFNEPIDMKAVLRSTKPSSDFVVKDMHKTTNDGRRPGFGMKSESWVAVTGKVLMCGWLHWVAFRFATAAGIVRNPEAAARCRWVGR